jgi:hypothetical protein
MLAVAFQAHGGQASVKNWKRSIKVDVEGGLRCSIGYWLRRVVDEQQLAELLQQHGKAAHAQRPQNQTLPRRRQQQQQQQQQQYEAGSEDEQQEQQQEEEDGQTQQQQQQAGFSQQQIRSIQQVSQLQQQQQQRRATSRRPQQLVCVRSKWYGRECFLVTDSSQTTLEQQQGAAAAAGDDGSQQQQQQREYLYTSWRDNTRTWRAVVSLPAAVCRTQLRSSSSSGSGTGAIVTIGNLYTSAAAAGTAADLAQLAVLGVWVGMRLNFPLESYSAEQQRQRSGAELLQYLQQLRLRVPGFAAAAAAATGLNAAAGVRRSARGLKGTAGDRTALARWHAQRAHQRRCGLCTGCLSGRSCVVAAWRRQQQVSVLLQLQVCKLGIFIFGSDLMKL